MEIKPIESDADYRAALTEAEALMTAAPCSPEGERLDVLVTLIEAHERKHHALDLPHPAAR
jgi:HTH-type transcriptional regulator/antitoxin HigA